jgi:hypothetical protein
MEIPVPRILSSELPTVESKGGPQRNCCRADIKSKQNQSWIERAPVVIRPGLYAPKRSLPFCSVLIQTASMEAEIDCKLQSNSR